MFEKEARAAPALILCSIHSTIEPARPSPPRHRSIAAQSCERYKWSYNSISDGSDAELKSVAYKAKDAADKVCALIEC